MQINGFKIGGFANIKDAHLEIGEINALIAPNGFSSKYYANFYGGILISSDDYEEVISRLKLVVESVGLTHEEIKWQKVNAYTEDRYKKILDELFAILGEGKAKMRIFFRHRRHEPAGLTNEQRRKEYQMLYYQFIKHAFGLRYCNPTGERVRIRLFLDDMPLKRDDRKEFLDAIYNLNTTIVFEKVGNSRTGTGVSCRTIPS